MDKKDLDSMGGVIVRVSQDTDGRVWIKDVTIEQPKEVNMKYKVGDRVKIKTWKEMKKEYGVDSDGTIYLSGCFVPDMEKYCGKIMTISRVEQIGYYEYYMKEDGGYWHWNDKMIKGLITKRAIFYCQRVIENGKECIQINGWENVLKRDELPEEYFEDHPYFHPAYYDDDLILVYANWGKIFEVYYHKVLSLEDWNKLYNDDGTGILQVAGERLSKILKAKKWHGKFEVKI